MTGAHSLREGQERRVERRKPCETMGSYGETASRGQNSLATEALLFQDLLARVRARQHGEKELGKGTPCHVIYFKYILSII